jgi:lysophospholipase L1-like esterase
LHKPTHTLGFVIATSTILAAISIIFPVNGIRFTDSLSLKYPTFQELFLVEKTAKKDISGILALADAEEKTDVKIKGDSTAEAPIDSLAKLNTNLQYKDGTKSALANFFNSLSTLSNEPKSIRILHYGDSQIEGDRISDYLRLKLQAQFGGEGPGLISFMPVAPSVINKLTWSTGWDRYTIFTGKDKRVKHNNFGALAHITRFSKYEVIADTTNYKSAWVKVITSKNGGPKAAAFNKLKLYYGGSQTKTHIELYENGSLNNSDSLLAGGNFNIKEFNLNQAALIHEFKFKGKDSPDFYGLSLEGGKGVMVDNMGLRGSSGTFFNQINFGQLKQFYDHLNTKLIILQFGGNALPYITTPEQTVQFANYLKSQILTIKKLAPQASILVIGPADMSVKVGTEYETHPQLENLRDAIKKAAFETNCAFFDMYSCMGGKNSMVAWVDLGIGAKDYIHFSSGGARKIAVLLYSSLINDYNTYNKKK